MTANRSLDEFADAASEEPDPDDAAVEDTTGREDDGGATTGVEGATDDGRDETAEPDAAASGDVTPATSTYAWSPEGGPCAACGERAEERWREGDGLVCGDCKDW